ncbi:MAG: VTT domain-containing protein [Nitrospirae bacterium]|nr:VTT domain-containing protein [Nitrospirota bacterium]
MKDIGLVGPENGKNSLNIIKTILLTFLLTGSLALVRYSPLGYYLDPAHVHLLQEKLAGYHSMAPVIFFAGGAILIAMGAPRSIIHILAGMVFGFFSGTLLSTAAAVTGSGVLFWLTRFLGRPLFHQKIGSRLKAVEGHLQSHGLLVIIMMRQLPLTCMFVSILIGLTSVRTSVFILGSIIGLLPAAAIFTLFGSSVRGGFALRVSIASCLLVLLILTVKTFYKRSPLGRELSQKLSKDKAETT